MQKEDFIMEKKNYAYLTKAGVLKVVENPNTAMEAMGESNIILTDIECKFGNPVVNGQQIIVYGPEEMKLEAKGGNIDAIPALAELYKKCMK